MERPLARGLFLFLYTPVLSATVNCPQFFSLRGGHCIHTSTIQKTYCEAQSFCRSIGGELATGERVTQLPLGIPKREYFIGASDLLDETSSFPRSKSRISFRWTDGSFAPNKFSGEI